MKPAIFSFVINALILGTLFSSLGQRATAYQPKALEVSVTPAPAPVQAEILPLPMPEPEPEPAPVNERAAKTLARVVCGEVGAHIPEAGRNVLQVIVNRANLKVSDTVSLEEALVAAATRRVGGTPQFATHCRQDSKRDWQMEIAREALRGEWVGSAEWLSEETLFFRTHVGAHLWERKRGWTKNIDRVGADEYHTFFDANEVGVRYMARY